MSFSQGWLKLREPYDKRARNSTVLDAVAAWAAPRQSVAVVDLACGLGSTLRATADRLPETPKLAAGRQRPEPSGARRRPRAAA